MHILSIGNSFSQDATKYIHQIAAADGRDVQVLNLYIGGCPLSLHAENIARDGKAYICHENGAPEGPMVSIRQALCMRAWDIVSMQQASVLSPYYDTYQPWLGQLSAYVTRYAPRARQVIHETWAYEADSGRFDEMEDCKDAADMHARLRTAYAQAADSLGGAQVIPCGDAMTLAVNAGIAGLYRDGFHASFGIGRYLLSAVWYEALVGGMAENTFSVLEEPGTPDVLAALRAYAVQAVREQHAR